MNKCLLYILVTFVDSDFNFDEYECADLVEVARLREELENDNYKFVSAQPVYG
jgi:hypothetical protein